MQYLQHIDHFVDGMKVVEILGTSTPLSDRTSTPLSDRTSTPQLVSLDSAREPSLSNHSDRASTPLTFFCMHGYGANAFDLAGLSQHLRFPPGTRFLFPDGILPIDLGMGAGYQGRAWFPIDWTEIEKLRREGGLRDLSNTLPAGMPEARAALIHAMERLECEPAKTVIGGFSQGAMLATEMALFHKEYFAGLLVLSGTLVNRAGWETMAREKFAAQGKTLQFCQSHGQQDPVLPFAAAERLHELLMANGGKGELVAFAGQHEIPPLVIERVNAWLGSGK